MGETANTLRGYRRELTKEIFEDLASLQCEIPEILGYVGTDQAKLERWCRCKLQTQPKLPMSRKDRKSLSESLATSMSMVSPPFPMVQR